MLYILQFEYMLNVSRYKFKNTEIKYRSFIHREREEIGRDHCNLIHPQKLLKRCKVEVKKKRNYQAQKEFAEISLK